MTTLTINVNDETEAEFREFAKQKYNGGKGYLGKAITEAMKKTIKEDKQKNAVEELKALMEKGFKLGGIKIKSRDEIYDRRIFPN
jgi:hypothetical protein